MQVELRSQDKHANYILDAVTNMQNLTNSSLNQLKYMTNRYMTISLEFFVMSRKQQHYSRYEL